MSKPGRNRRATREAKREGWGLPPEAEPLPTLAVVGLGNRPLTPLAPTPPLAQSSSDPAQTKMGKLILGMLRTWPDGRGIWSDDPLSGGITTGDLAARLHIRPRSPERDLLRDTLTALRKRHLLRYEMRDGALRWWIREQH